MKWISIKTYMPPTGTKLLIRMVRPMRRHFSDNVDPEIIEEEFVTAHLTCLTKDIKNTLRWEMFFGDNLDADREDYTVTHFAIIDAVEWE